ncbi:MAG: bifunctional diguanylate cyclase/phosphodiesterase [Pseudomonadota bacterium]
MPADVSKKAPYLRHRIFVVTLGTMLAVAVTLSGIAYAGLRAALRESEIRSLSGEAEAYAARVIDANEGVMRDAGFLAGTPDVQDALVALSSTSSTPQTAPADAARTRLERTFAEFLSRRPYLTGARLIERSGRYRELVRVVRTSAGTQAIIPTGLQPRDTEAYIMASTLLFGGEWTFSPIEIEARPGADGAETPTLRIVYAVPTAEQVPQGFVVLDVDVERLLHGAVYSAPPAGILTLTSVTGRRMVFTSENMEPALQPPPAPDAPEAVAPEAPVVEVSRRAVVAGGNGFDVRLAVPRSYVFYDANRKSLGLLAASLTLLVLGSAVAGLLGRRLAGHLSRLAEAVTSKQDGVKLIELEGSGFREAQVLAERFQSVFNALALQSQELAWHSIHDQLSGLRNRRGLEDAIASIKPSERTVAIAHMDLDRFKLVNDTLGHDAGDAVILAIARRLRSLCEPTDIIARIGGDEFVVIRPGADREEITAFAEQALPALAEPVMFEGRECRFGVSIGAAAADISALRSGDLDRAADQALYLAKNEGRGRVRFFSADMERRLRDRSVLALELERALEAEELTVAYMPKVAASDRRLIGMEALVRWQHPERGSLSPGLFLPIADEMKLTPAIDAHVLRNVLADRDAWCAAGVFVPPISVNVSARRLLDPDLAASVSTLGITPGAISFELLESVFLDDVSEHVRWNCDLLREMGIGIEIDDFGSGHASILGITRMKPDWVKIDAALVRNVTEADSDRTLVRAIVEMATAFDIAVMAEGVETEDQARLLCSMGCAGLQGYHIGRPGDAGAMAALLGLDDPKRRA